MKTQLPIKRICALLTVIVGQETRTDCYWCGLKLRTCDTCRGAGFYAKKVCLLCNGVGSVCPNHGKDWE